MMGGVILVSSVKKNLPLIVALQLSPILLVFSPSNHFFLLFFKSLLEITEICVTYVVSEQ